MTANKYAGDFLFFSPPFAIHVHVGALYIYIYKDGWGIARIVVVYMFCYDRGTHTLRPDWPGGWMGGCLLALMAGVSSEGYGGMKINIYMIKYI